MRSKSSWAEIKIGKFHANYSQGQNRLNLKKINLIYCQLKLEYESEKQTKPLHPASYQIQLYSFNHNSFTFSPHSIAVFWGMRAMVSPQQLLLPSHAFFPLHQSKSVPQAAVLHKLLQHSSPPGKCLHMPGTCSSVSPPQDTGPTRKRV